MLISGDLNTPLSTTDRSSKQKINKETRVLNDTPDQMDLIDIYRTFHPKTTEYSFFLSAHGTSSRIDHILGHKSGLNQYQKIEIISFIFSDHNTVILELNYKKKFGRNSNTWKLKSVLIKTNGLTRKLKKNFRNSRKQMRMKTQWFKTFGIQQKWP